MCRMFKGFIVPVIIILVCFLLSGDGEAHMHEKKGDNFCLTSGNLIQSVEWEGQAESLQYSLANYAEDNTEEAEDEDNGVPPGYIFLLVVWLSVMYALFILSRMKSKK